LHDTEDAISALARLTELDRRWILERLSAAAKGRLVDSAGRGSSQLCAVGVDAAVSVLQSEPAWVVHAVLTAGAWPWKKGVMQRLRIPLRMEVTRLEHARVTLAQPAVDFLLRQFLERTARQQFVHEPASRFESLLTRLSGKS